MSWELGSTLMNSRLLLSFSLHIPIHVLLVEFLCPLNGYVSGSNFLCTAFAYLYACMKGSLRAQMHSEGYCRGPNTHSFSVKHCSSFDSFESTLP